jgi:hypothetical protein
MLWDIAGAYPWAFVGLIVLPIFAGLGALVTGFAGYENLKHQLASDQQAQRIEQGVNEIRDKNTALETTTALLKTYEEKLAASGNKDAVLTALINQYQRLSHSTALFGAMARKDMSQERGKIAAEMLNILNQDVVHTVVRDDIPGTPLMIEIGPNSYRVIFSVPMRVTPRLTFTGLPQGSSASVSSASEIGFTVTFFPLSIPVRLGQFGVVASAEL